jgi:ATP-dependent protease ClpP protease subunit
MSDISAFLENVKVMENTIYDILAEKTKKDAAFWRENMKSDMFLTSEQLLSYGLIDQII